MTNQHKKRVKNVTKVSQQKSLVKTVGFVWLKPKITECAKSENTLNAAVARKHSTWSSEQRYRMNHNSKR